MHSTVDGHLGDFQFGAILNNAAVNILAGVFGGHISLLPLGIYWFIFKIYFIEVELIYNVVLISVLGIYLAPGLLGHRIHVFSLVDTAKQFSKMVVPIFTTMSRV